MDVKNIDWDKLDFSYKNMPYRYRAYWKDGEWLDGSMVTNNNIVLSESATSIHYGQQCFEGMKAQCSQDGDVLLFRPEENAKRFQNSARRLRMPAVSKEMFLNAVKSTVQANIEYVPPYGHGASMYIRPLLIGIGDNLGVKPAPEYLFTVFVVPVGPYFKEGFKPVKMKIELEYDRAAPQGTGDAKVGGNYSAGILPVEKAREEGYSEVIYLDAREKKYFEETGAANLFFVFKNGDLATPKSNAILPSITRKSIVEIARKDFDLNMEHRQVSIDELENIEEAGACGTAAVITPIGTIGYKGQDYNFYADGKEPGPITTKLYKQLTQIQVRDIEDTHGWTEKIGNRNK